MNCTSGHGGVRGCMRQCGLHNGWAVGCMRDEFHEE